MSDETEGQGNGTEAVAGGVDPTAMAIALDEARSNPALKSKIEAFLNKQISLIGVQLHHLHEQFKQLRLDSIVSDSSILPPR